MSIGIAALQVKNLWEQLDDTILDKVKGGR